MAEEVVLRRCSLANAGIALKNHGNVASIGERDGQQELDGRLGRQQLVLLDQRRPHGIQHLLCEQSAQRGRILQHHLAHLGVSCREQEMGHWLRLGLSAHSLDQVLSRRSLRLEIRQVVGRCGGRVDKALAHCFRFAQNGQRIRLFVLELVLAHFRRREGTTEHLKEAVLLFHACVVGRVASQHHDGGLVDDVVLGFRVVFKENELVVAEIEQQSVQSAEQSLVQ